MISIYNHFLIVDFQSLQYYYNHFLLTYNHILPYLALAFQKKEKLFQFYHQHSTTERKEKLIRVLQLI